MSKSDTLRLHDVRAAFRLIGDCRDEGNDPDLWHRRVLDGVALLFGAVQAAGGEVLWQRPGRSMQPVAAYSVSADRGADDAFRAYNREVGWNGDPIHQAMNRLPSKLITRTRRELVTDACWYRSATYNEYFRTGGIDHQIVSVLRLSDGGATSIIALNRAIGDRDFSARECRLLEFFHAELGRLVGGPLVGASDATARALPPRLRETLACLLEGDSEKQVAARLRLSRATVHQYVTALYRHFAVRSRAQLIAHVLKRGA